MKIFFKKFVLFLALFLVTFPAHAELPGELSRALDDIYNANFTRATAVINAYITANPNHADGYLLRGILKEWDQVVNNKRNALNGSIMADYVKANELAKSSFETDKSNVDKMILLGNTHMYMAKKYVDMGRKMKGGGELKQAKNLMLDAVAKNPNAYDAYFALGVFNYFSANVPSGLKWLTVILGFNGTKAKGFEYITKAADHKNLTQGDAAFLLVYIYGDKEHNYDKALQYNTMMKTKYPYNPKFQYDEGELLFRAKRFDDAKGKLTTFIAACESKGKDCNNKYKFLANYHLAKMSANNQDYAGSLPYVLAAEKVDDGQYKGFTLDIALWHGLAAKKSGDKETAANMYKKIEEKQSENMTAWEIAKKELAP